MKETEEMKNVLAGWFISELEAETESTRKCLERIPMKFSGWKPHDTSMAMGDLATIVSDIPTWITIIIEPGFVDFADYQHFRPGTTEELVSHFDEAMRKAVKSLQNSTEGTLSGNFSMKNKGEVLATSTKKEAIGQTINHLVHHRGQLTVYMRMNDIKVPSIYGPSGDDKKY
ncbi:MAG: DinB family protein [Syntrophothermus sp.]